MQEKIAGFINGVFSTRTPKALFLALYACQRKLEKANRRILFLEYQLRQASIAFENLKRNQSKTETAEAETKTEKNTSAKRTRLLLLARKHHLPEIAPGFGGKKIIFSNDFLEELFQKGVCEKLLERLLVPLNELCLSGPLSNNTFNQRPLNGKIRSVPVGASIVNITNKYRLIFREEEKNGIVVFYKIKRRESHTYR